jgi:isopentenyl-diphosphate delta-isomerase
MAERKSDHIKLALNSQVNSWELDTRFHYEPMLQGHPHEGLAPVDFLGRRVRVPLWVSSMTGGTDMAKKINTNLATACHEFGMGMGLGSCRVLLEDDSRLADFDLRDIIGNDLPFYANMGISQVEQLLEQNRVDKIHHLVDRLRADGLIIHVNPLQEWFQPEGDRIKVAPIETISRFLDQTGYKVIVKEVGQGIGPESLRALFRLPIAAVEFAAFGGTNFSKLELSRNNPKLSNLYESFSLVGETAVDMAAYVNRILEEENAIKCREVIISGGIKNYLDGYYLLRVIHTRAIYGQASVFLKHAKESYDALHQYIKDQVNGLKLAYAYLTPRK